MKKLEDLRDKLNSSIINNNDELTNEEVVSISQELDKIIVETQLNNFSKGVNE